MSSSRETALTNTYDGSTSKDFWISWRTPGRQQRTSQTLWAAHSIILQRRQQQQFKHIKINKTKSCKRLLKEMNAQSHHTRSNAVRCWDRWSYFLDPSRGRVCVTFALTLSVSQVLTLIIQQSMLHHTSSCILWNTNGSRQISATRCVCVHKNSMSAKGHQCNQKWTCEVFCWPLEHAGWNLPFLKRLPASSLSCLTCLMEETRKRWRQTEEEQLLSKTTARIPAGGGKPIRPGPALVGGGWVQRSLHQAARLHHVTSGQREALKLRRRDQIEAWNKSTGEALRKGNNKLKGKYSGEEEMRVEGLTSHRII